MKLLSFFLFTLVAIVSASADADSHDGTATLATRSLGEAEPLCGAEFENERLAASLPSSFFSSTSNPCGNTVRVTNAASGDDVTATVTDSCGGLNCLSDDDIALSQDALNALGDSSGFPIRVTWTILG
ncbi:hypothetical protein C8Q76DRAFT_293571 [Earliella scabrosa]|nr:hypothetical protein C8Q76DRAFT_293571 [Earliella scabrosa]